MREHLPHVLMLAVPFLLFTLVFWFEWQRSSATPVPSRLVVMGWLGLSAGLVHAAVVGHHLDASVVLGVFFALAAALQIGQALVVLFTGDRRVVLGGVALQLCLVGLWAWTRVVGIPFGVAGGTREAAGALDLACVGLELGAAVAGLSWAYGVKGVAAACSKWLTSTTMNSPVPRKVSTPSGLRPSQETKSLRPS